MSALEPLPPTDALQQQPTPPLATLHFPDDGPFAPNIALPANSTVWTKLSLLLHAHELAKSAARRVLLWRIVLLFCALGAAVPLGILSGIGMFWSVYQDPSRYIQDYSTAEGTTYYISGRKVTLQEYDYYRRSNGNEPGALVMAISTGIIVGGVTVGVFWWLLRPRKPTVMVSMDEQIATIAKDHPEAVASWGSVAVLRVPQLIERLLDMQSNDARR